MIQEIGLDETGSAKANLGPLTPEEMSKVDAYWRATNYLSVGQIYLKDNPLLERPLTLEDVKPRSLGHWGTTPGLNFLYVHWSRLICERDLNMLYVIGPGHGGPGLVASTYLEGSYSEIYPFKRVPCLASRVGAAEQWYSENIQRHRLYVAENGDDLPEIKDWSWPQD